MGLHNGQEALIWDMEVRVQQFGTAEPSYRQFSPVALGSVAAVILVVAKYPKWDSFGLLVKNWFVGGW